MKKGKEGKGMLWVPSEEDEYYRRRRRIRGGRLAVLGGCCRGGWPSWDSTVEAEKKLKQDHVKGDEEKLKSSTYFCQSACGIFYYCYTYSTSFRCFFNCWWNNNCARVLLLCIYFRISWYYSVLFSYSRWMVVVKLALCCLSYRIKVFRANARMGESAQQGRRDGARQHSS